MDCNGRLQCKWCHELPNKNYATDNQEYCENKTEICFPRFPIPNIPDSENSIIIIIFGISVSGFVVAVVSAIMLFCFFKSKRNETRESIPGAFRNRSFKDDHNYGGEVLSV